MNARRLCLGLLASLLLLGGNLRGDEDPRKPKVLEVQVSQPLNREVVDYEDFTGRLDADTVMLKARVSGYLEKISYKPGSVVKRGDVLFEMDARPYQAELDTRLAQLTRAETRLKAATKNLARARVLLGNKGIGQEEYDVAESAAAAAKAEVVVAQAQAISSKLNLQFARVVAPIDGKIGLPELTVGNLVVADQTSLATIVKVDPLAVVFDVDARSYLRLRKRELEEQKKSGKEVERSVMIGVGDEDAFPHRAQVDSVSINANAKTDTIRYHAILSNKDGLLLPGMFARVRLVTSAPHKALLVAERALLSDRGQKYLLIVNDQNKVLRRNVTVGALHGDLRVIKEGLKAGEWVLVNELDRVKPDSIVKPVQTEMPTKFKADKAP